MLLIADFIRTRAKNIGNEVLMGCSVFPGVGLCILEANVLFNEEGSGLRLIFTTEFDRHALLWGVFNEARAAGPAPLPALCGGGGAAAALAGFWQLSL